MIIDIMHFIELDRTVESLVADYVHNAIDKGLVSATSYDIQLMDLIPDDVIRRDDPEELMMVIGATLLHMHNLAAAGGHTLSVRLIK